MRRTTYGRDGQRRVKVDVRGVWRARRDSNPRPSGPQPDALSTELRAHATLRGRLAEREGFEPSKQVTPLGGLANRCTRPLCDLSAERGEPESYHGPTAGPARHETLTSRSGTHGDVDIVQGARLLSADRWTATTFTATRHDRFRNLDPEHGMCRGEAEARPLLFCFPAVEEGPAGMIVVMAVTAT